MALCGILAAPAARAETVTVGVVRGVPTIFWPIYAGISQGFYKAQGLDLDIVQTPSSQATLQQMSAGSLVFGSAGMTDPVHAIERGAPIAVIRIEGENAPYNLLGQRTIKRMEDLKGKTVSLDSAKGITRIYVERMLGAHGIKPGQFDMIFAGATSDRFAALQAGAADAAILAAPFNFRAEGLGFTNLGLTIDYVKGIPFSAWCVNKDWAEAHKAEVKKFLAAYERTVDWFYDAKNRDAAIKVALDNSPVSPDDAAKSYDFFRKIGFFQRTGKVSTLELQNVIDVMKQLGDIEKPITGESLVLPGVTPLG